jgi:hypothetical protein
VANDLEIVARLLLQGLADRAGNNDLPFRAHGAVMSVGKSC